MMYMYKKISTIRDTATKIQHINEGHRLHQQQNSLKGLQSCNNTIESSQKSVHIKEAVFRAPDHALYCSMSVAKKELTTF